MAQTRKNNPDKFDYDFEFFFGCPFAEFVVNAFKYAFAIVIVCLIIFSISQCARYVDDFGTNSARQYIEETENSDYFNPDVVVDTLETDSASEVDYNF